MTEPQSTQPNTPPNSDYYNTSSSPMVHGYDLSRYQYFLASPFYAGFDNFQDPKRKLFLEDFFKMPSSVRGFLTSIETAKTIFTAGQENKLEEFQIYQTAELIRDLILGKIFIKELSIVLAQKTNIEDSRAIQLANKIISQSFGPIIEDVKRTQRSKFPDKISQIQKEGQPAGLRQVKPPTPAGIDKMPLNRPQPQSPQPPQPARPQPVPSQPSPPPPSQPSSIRTAPAPTPLKPPSDLGMGPRSQQPSDQPKSSMAPQNRPQFKVPDLGSSFGPRPEARPGPMNTPFDNAQRKQSPDKPVPTPPINVRDDAAKTNKSLEEELEKVANVIDLRSKSEN